jgi:hypothetical protein
MKPLSELRKNLDLNMKLTESERNVVKAVLLIVEQSLEHDKSNGKGHLSPDAEWIDVGNFTIKMTGAQLKLLQSAFKKI